MKAVAQPNEIKVIGSGVAGLTTALTLLESGYKVSIITKEHFEHTVSAKAAAIWFPYSAKPIHKVNSWSKLSLSKYKELSLNNETGVSFVPFSISELNPDPPFWLNALTQETKVFREKTSLLNHIVYRYTVEIPLIETQIYLTYLRDLFLEKGGTIALKEIKDLSNLAENNLVVNCTGLASQDLCNDDQLYPIKGQILKIEPSKDIIGQALNKLPGQNKQELAYIISRSDCTILGGSAYKNDKNLTIDQDLTDRIRKRCIQMEPHLASKKILSSEVGLRPGRNEVRLEKDGELSLIHNYGHGGAGFTVSWGCAAEVLSQANKYFKA